MNANAIGIDAGAGGATALLVDSAGTVVKRAAAGGDDAIAKVLKALGGSRVPVVGIAAGPGALDPVRGVTARMCTPGEALVSAEAWVGAAQGVRDAIGLWIGERVFAGVMLDGRPWRGAHGHAGSAAWLALNPVERQDYRRSGNLAAEVSHVGIARRLSWRLQSGDRSTALDRAGSLDALTAAHVFEAARAGDGVATSIVRETAKYIGMAMANLAAAVDPEVIILAGDLSAAGDLLIEPVAHECARRLPPALQSVLRVKLSPLGVDAVALGAARLASTAAA